MYILCIYHSYTNAPSLISIYHVYTMHIHIISLYDHLILHEPLHCRAAPPNLGLEDNRPDVHDEADFDIPDTQAVLERFMSNMSKLAVDEYQALSDLCILQYVQYVQNRSLHIILHINLYIVHIYAI